MTITDSVQQAWQSAWQPVRQKLKDNCFNAQFILYEGSNVNAAIVGTGGYNSFAHDITTTFSNENLSTIEQITTLGTQHPDAASAIGIGGVVIAAPLIKRLTDRVHQKISDAVDITGAGLSGLILTNAIINDASLITSSACSFVAASAVLKYAGDNPFFLKPGGLGLTLGGGFLAAFGIEQGAELYANAEPFFESGKTTLDNIKTIANAALPALTTLTGAYVAKAGLLTYEGGYWETLDFKDRRAHGEAVAKPEKKRLSDALFDPVDGHISRIFGEKADKAVMGLNGWFKKHTMPWISESVKADKPFETSHQLRAPWRLATAGAAVAAGQPGFAASNLGWLGGDYTFRLIQEKKDEEISTPPPPQPKEVPPSV